MNNIFVNTISLTLTFDLKIKGNTYSLRASAVPNFATFKERGQKILSGYHLVYRQTDQQV